MSAKKRFPIRFEGLKGSIECDENFMKDDATQWQRYLKYARDNKNTSVVTCSCLPADNEGVKRQLKVHLSQSSDQCYLSSYAFTGHEHSPECRFYSVWPDGRQAAIYTADVVKAGADGVLIVRLPTGLQKKEASQNEPRNQAIIAISEKRHRQPSMRLLGLLHLLWEQSGINIWHPAFDRRSRNPGWVTWRLQQTAARIRIGKIPLLESMLLMAIKNTQQATANRLRTLAAENGKRRLIIVSMLASWTEAAEERLHHTLPLGHFSGFPDLQLPNDVLTRLCRSYSRELSHWRAGSKVMVICETEPPEKLFKRVRGKTFQ